MAPHKRTTQPPAPNPSPPTEAPPAPPGSNTTTSTGGSADKSPPVNAPTSPQRWTTNSWRGKATAVAEVARDSVSAAVGSPGVERTPGASGPRPGSIYRGGAGLRTLSKSGPTTGITKGGGGGEEMDGRGEKGSAAEVKEGEGLQGDGGVGGEVVGVKEVPVSAGWMGMGWWSRAEGVEEGKEGKDGGDGAGDNAVLGEESKKTTFANKDGDMADTIKDEQRPVPRIPAAASQEEGKPVDKPSEDTAGDSKTVDQRSSWFGLWGSAPTTNGEQPSQKGALAEPAASNVASDGFSTLDEPPAPAPESQADKTQTEARNSGSWAFWSSNVKADGSKHAKTDSKGEEGELAIAKTMSESNPQPARLKEPESASSGRSTPNDSDQVLKKTTVEGGEEKTKPKETQKRKPTLAYNMADSILKTSFPRDADGASISSEDKPKKQTPPNLLLPDLYDTLPFREEATYVQSLWRMLSGTSSQPQRHLVLTKHPPKIKKAVAIGVHGYFPSPLVQKVLGPVTGTSLKFANAAADAISRHLPSIPSPTIEKIALEGEGMIASRIDTLWRLLLNFTSHLRTADFILIACHSQGVPVSLMLLSRLLAFGVLQPHARIGVCAMAGVNLGPFSSLQSRILGAGSANELFDFCRPDSRVATAYREALQTCLRQGVRVLYVGSIDDQLVSLESSLFGTISHPCVYRAVFVDGRIHAPGFVTALVGLCAKLRNRGVGDHGLVHELSGPLAGSLYSGEGHSRIYEDGAVYDLAVRFALETVETGRGGEEAVVERYEGGVQTGNPYVLPWAMRGVLEEEIVKRELSGEIEALVAAFEEWKPVTKVLRDVKVRLEGLRSKL